MPQAMAALIDAGAAKKSETFPVLGADGSMSIKIVGMNRTSRSNAQYMINPRKNSNVKPRPFPESSWPLATCAHCREPYRVAPNLARRQRYCSLKCASQARGIHRSAKPRARKAGSVKKPMQKNPLIKLAASRKSLPGSRLPKIPRDLRAFRRSLNLNQCEFWKRIGVTQSGGSRYEAERKLSRPVALLLETVYLKGVALDRLNDKDFAILEYIKTRHPEWYADLDKAVRALPASGGE